MSSVVAERHIAHAFALWEERNKYDWELDLSVITASGIRLRKNPEASQRSKIASTELHSAKLSDVPESISCFVVGLEGKKSFDIGAKPTEIPCAQAAWLYVENNKYPEELVDYDKVGKWKLFVNRDQVNQVWGKIKKGIFDSNLWQAKVSTVNPDRPVHAIMVYTKDYADLDDVIRVLDYLERANIKPRNKNIRYKTDQQTYAGIYAGGKERPWIYASETIRSMRVLPKLRACL